MVNANNTVVSTLSGKCMDTDGKLEGSGVIIKRCGVFSCCEHTSACSCNGGDSQQWVYNSADFTFKQKASGLHLSFSQNHSELSCLGMCLDAGTVLPPLNPCTLAPGKDQPWCNTALGFEARVRDLVSRIPNADKIGLVRAVQCCLC